MNMDGERRIYELLRSKGLENIIVTGIKEDTRQLRFSNNLKDLTNYWKEEYAVVFSSLGKKVASTTIKSFNDLEKQIDKFVSLITSLPENETFHGINSQKMDYSSIRDVSWEHPDIDSMAKEAIEGALSAGAQRATGLVYSRSWDVSLVTDYNSCSYSMGDVELVVRAFTGDFTGQESLHAGPDSINKMNPHDVGFEAGMTSREMPRVGKPRPSRYTVLMSPYLLGNILSYCSMYFSQYQIDSHLSPLESRLDTEVSHKSFTLMDNPLDYGGAGAVPVDDEGTPTRKNTLIDHGVVKTILQSYSTAKMHGTETTGNAGVISPKTWQLEVLPGTRKFKDMISEIKDGLFINNAWYTRFQDYRNGVFSTVPRDGVFHIKDGGIDESWSGIRISDSFLNILSNIKDISSERKRVKWWEEISPSYLPYVLVDNVEISMTS